MVFSNANTKRTIISISAAQTASETQTVRTIEKLSKSTSILKSLTLLLMGMAFFVGGVKGQYSIAGTGSGNTYTQNFDAFRGTSATLPANWAVSSATYNATYAVLTSGAASPTVSNASGNNCYAGRSSSSSTNYCILQKQATSGSTTFTFSATNGTGSTLNGFTITWNAKQYSQAGRPTTLDFQYRINGGSYVKTGITGTTLYTATTGSSTTFSESSTSYSITITGISITANQTVDFQFVVANGGTSGSNAHLGVDDFNMYASATPTTYTLTYSGNSSTSGTAPTDASSPYSSGASITTQANSGTLAKTNYTFAGWNTATDGSGTSYAVSTASAFSMPAANTTLYAKWTYNVTYNGNSNTSGSVPTDATNYTQAAAVTTAANSGSLVRTGYAFAGWNTAADGTGTSYTASQASAFTNAGNITLYAKWSPTYTLTYSGNTNTSGTAPTDGSSPYVSGAAITTQANSGTLAKTNYTFAGWNTSADGSGTSYAVSTASAFSMPAANTTLYAKWTYNVTYNGNSNTGGTVPTDATNYTQAAAVTTAANSGSLVRTGYTFSGWNTAADGSGTSYTVSQASAFTNTGNITLYAKWTPTYTLTYSGNTNTSGTAPNDGSSPYISGASVTTAANSGTLVKTNYTFAGWNTAADGSGTSYSVSTASAFAMPSANTTLYAKWTYTVTYNGNSNTGGTVPTDATNYTQTASVTTAANSGSLVRTGYTFAGWNTLANGTGTSYSVSQASAFTNAGNITLYAKWTINSYNLSYDGNGSDGGTAVSSSSNNYNASVTLPSCTFTLTGYTFSTWNTQADGLGTDYAAGAPYSMPASATTLYAKWISAALPVCPSSTAVTPSATQTVCQGVAASLLTAAITNTGAAGSPTLLYQWYYNTTNSNTVSGATVISGATNSTYTPLSTAAEVGTRYYFCVGYATDNSCGQSNTTQSLASNTVQVTVNATPSAPTGTAAQSFCSGASPTVANLTATGSSLIWYTTAGGATVATGALVDGTTYYVSQTVSNCESSARFAVVATVNTTPSVTTANTASVCSGGTTSISLTASAASTFAWTLGTNTGSITGASASNGSSIAQALTNPSNSTAGSIVYAVTPTSTVGSCVGSATNITVTVNPTPAVTNATSASTCSGTSPSLSLTASAASTFAWTLGINTGSITGATATSGSSIAQTLTNPSNSTAGSVVYAVTPTATLGSCVGTATNVTITVNPAPSLTNSTTPSTCSGTSPALSLTASVASSFAWTLGTNTGSITGATATSGTSINQTLTNPSNSTAGSIVYTVTPTATLGSCAGTPTNVTVTVNPAPVAPTGTTPQIFCVSGTVASLSATGTGILWYAAVNGGVALSTSTALVNGTIYYASQTVGGCESSSTNSSRLAVTATITSLTAPTATAATSTTSNGFTANWGSVGCATSYALDVYTGTSSTLSEGFETGLSTSGYITGGGSLTSLASGTWTFESGGLRNATNVHSNSYSCQIKTGATNYAATTLNDCGVVTFWWFNSTPPTVKYGTTTYATTQIANTGSWYQFSCAINSIASNTLYFYNSSGATGYLDDVSMTASRTNIITGQSVVGTTYNVTGLSGSTTYNYVVRSVNGTSSVNSNVISVTTTTPSYYSKSTGNLDVLSTWGTNTDGTGTAPADFTTAGVVYNIVNNTTPTIGAAWTVSGSGAKVVVGDGTATAINFTIPSSFAYTGTIDVTANSILTLQNTIPTIGTLSATSTVVYDGGTAQNISAATYGNLTVQNSGAAKTLAGAVTLLGNTFILASGTTLTSGTNVISFNAAGGTATINGIFQTANSTGFSGGAATSISSTNTPTVTLGATSTIEYNATSTSQAITARADYYNLILTGGSSGSFLKAMGTTPTIVAGGTFTVNSTAIANFITTQMLFGGAGCTVNINGTLQTQKATGGLTGASTSVFQSTNAPTVNLGASSTIIYNGTGAQVVSANTYANLTISGTRSSTPTITLASGTITVTGTVSNAISGAVVWSNSGNTFDYASASAQTIAALFYNDLTNSGNGARTLVGTTGTIDIAGTYTPTTAAITVSTSTINFSGADGQTIPATNYYSLSSSNNARTLASTGSIIIAGTFTTGTGLYTIGTSTINFNGTTAQTIPIPAVASGSNYYNLTYSGTSTATLSGNTSIAGDISITNGILVGTSSTNRTVTATNLTMSTGTVFRMVDETSNPATGTFTLNLNGNLTINGNAELYSAYYTTVQPTGVGNINLKGNLSTVNSSGDNLYTYSTTNGTITFTGTGGSPSSTQIISFSDPTKVHYTNFSVANGAYVQLNSNVTLSAWTTPVTNQSSFTILNGGYLNMVDKTITINLTSYPSYNSNTSCFASFNLNSGGTLVTSNSNGLSTNGSVQPGSISQLTRTFSSAANYEFKGATTGVFISTPTANTVNNLTINSSGTTLSQPFIVTGTVGLTAGILTTTATNSLTLTNTANTAISGGSTSAFINGPITWTLGSTSTGTYTIPLGVTSVYYPLAFVTGTNTGSPTITAQAFTATTGSVDATLSSVSSSEYWKLVTTGSFNASSFSIAKSNLANLTTFNTIGSNTSNSSYTDIGGNAGTLSGQNGVVSSVNGLTGAGTKYLALGVISSSPNVSVSGTLTALTTTYGLPSTTTSFNVSGQNLTADVTIKPPVGFEVSTTTDFSSNIGNNSSPLVVSASGTLNSTPVYVRLLATASVGTYNGNITCSTTGAALSKSVATVNSSVTAKALSIAGLTIPASRTYDGTTFASVTGTPALATSETAGTGTSTDGNPITGDDVSLSVGSVTGTYNSANVTSATTITIGGITLAGTSAANYTLTTTASASITTAALSLTASAQSKNYGVSSSTSGTINTNYTISGLFGSDAVNVALAYSGSPAGNLATANAGTYTITPSITSFSTGTSSNYGVPSITTGTLTINGSVPSVPTVTAIIPGNNQLTINFTAGSTGGYAITNYKYSTDGGLSFKSAGTSSSPLVITVASGSAASLANGTSYDVQIKAVNSLGDGAATSTVAATPINASVPGAPTIVSATATGNSGEVAVAFVAPVSNGNATITTYTATSNPGGITGTLSQSGSGTITVTGLSNGTSYTFSVTATNVVGTGAASSSSSSTIPFIATPKISVSTAGNYTFTVPVGVTSLVIESYGAGGGGGGTGANFTLGGGGAGGSYVKHTIAVTPGTVYNYTVGSGGTAGTSAGTSGSQGGSTFFGNNTAGASSGAIILSTGGAGGGGNVTAGTSTSNWSGGVAALGGIGSISGNLPVTGAAINSAGSNGETPVGGVTKQSGAGGVSSGPDAGSAGAYRTTAGTGNSGSSPGGGASGGITQSGTSAGGKGGDGGLFISYTLPITTDILTPGITTYNFPTGVTQALIECWGSGGAGGSATGSTLYRATGGGASAGAYANKLLTVNPSTNYTVSVGASVTSSTANNAVVNGNASYFKDATTVFAEGGAGGKSVLVSNAVLLGVGGVASSSSSIGDVVYKGGNGSTSTDASNSTGSSSGGGGSGAITGIGNNATLNTGGSAGNGGAALIDANNISISGAGGTGGSSGANGGPGSAPGGGGGGAWAAASTSVRTGGAGGAGQINVNYYLVPTISGTSPTYVAAGSGSFTITATGTNFFNGISAITWGGVTLTTTYVNAYTLTATVPTANIASPGTVAIGITNTGAYGTSTSLTTQTFTINPSVTFDANTGTGSMSVQGIFANTSANLTTNTFTKIGYTFSGWATTAGGAVAYADGASYSIVTSNVTLFAKWTANTYTVAFNNNGGTGTMSNQSVTYDLPANLTSNTFTRTGYTFAGWATTSGGSVAYANGASYTTGASNVTLYAKWTGIAGNWVGTNSTSWNTSANWADGNVPSSGANVTINAGTTFPPVLDVDATVGNLVVATGTALSVGAKTLTLNGTYNAGSQLGTIAATTAGNIIFNGSAGTVYFTPTFSTFNNITVNTGATVNLVNTVSNNGTFSLTGGTLNVLAAETLGNFSISGGALNINTGVNLTFSGTYSGTGGAMTNGGTITLTGGSKTFPGNAVTFPTTTVSGNTLPYMNNLTISLSSSTNAITWSTPGATMIIAGTLTLTNGIVTTSLTNNLSLANPVTGLSGGSASSYINGPLGIGYTASGVTGTYPIGAGGNYRPVQFTYTACATCATSPNIVIIQQNEGAYPSISSSYSTARFGNRYYTVIQSPGAYPYTMNINNNGGTATGTAKAFVWEYDGNLTYAANTNITAAPTSTYYGFSFSPTAITNTIDYVELTETSIPLTITSAVTANKVYDGNTTATVSGATLSGVVSPDAVTLVPVYRYSQSTPGTSLAITSTSSITGTNAAAYTLSQPSLTARDINTGTVGSWLGVVSTDYNNVANWQSYSVPLASSNVTIPASGITNYPVLAGATTLNNLTINSGTLSLNGQTLTVNGTISGAGTITPTATSSLVIGGTAGTINFTSGSNTIKDLTLNSSATATLGGTTNITAGVTPGTVTIASGATLNTGGNLVIKSDALGTARISQSAGTISGNVTVERFITAKSGRRFSFVGTPVTQSVRNGWQQQIYISGPGTGGLPCGSTTGNGQTSTDKYNSNGFDATITGANTILQYNAAVVKSSHYSGIANTGVSLSPGTGYSVNIRGNRNSATVTCDNQLNNTAPTAPEAVTLSATGTVTTGNLVVALNDKAVHNFTLLANPYPSQISFLAFKGDNSIINNKMWTFSPFGSGNFTTLSNGHIVNGATGYDDTYGNIIASGQAFFVEANTNGSVTFSESHKVSGSLPNTQYFGIAPEKSMRIGFYSASTRLDEILLIYNKQGTKDYDANWDATSMSLTSQSLVAYKGSNKLAIAYLPDSTVADTTQLGVAIKAGSYALKFSQLETIDSLQTITLVDKFLGTSTDIRSNSTYNFNVTTDTASKGANRFKVVLSGAVPLAVNFVGINATQNTNCVAVNWSVANEAKIASYSVERSTDGVHFTAVSNCKATGASTYTVQDANLPASANTLYYRVKAIDNLGKATYTNVIVLTIQDSRFTGLSIFPNPVQRKLNLTIAGSTSGSLYTVKITTATGKLAFTKSAVPVSGNAITFDASSFAAGVYLIELTDAKGNKLVSKFVKD